MKTTTIPYSEGPETFDVVVAHPDEAGPRPAILVCHAWGGRNPFAEAKAVELSRLGYIGAAIDVYGIGKRGTDPATSGALMNPLLADPACLRRRLAAALETVADLEGVDSNRLGAIGFCFGGLCSLLMARMGLPLRGVVSFHGLLKIGERLETKVPAQILVEHGQDDPLVPVEDVANFAAEMKRIGADWQLHAYPGVMHAFTNPEANSPENGMAYDADADRRSWNEMRRFFEDVLA